MRARFFKSKKDAAVEARALSDQGSKFILCGPAPYLVVQTEASNEYIPAEPAEEIYLLISECDPSVANFTVVAYNQAGGQTATSNGGGAASGKNLKPTDAEPFFADEDK